jgi:hypothetical protein
MRGRPAEVEWKDVAPSAVGVGVFAMLLMALANVDPAATEVRAFLAGLLGLVVAVAASPHEATAPPEEESRERQTSWHEYDGSFRGM